MKRFNLIVVLAILLPTMLFGAEGGIMGYLIDSWKTIVGMLVLVFGAFWVPGLRGIMIIGIKVLIGPKMRKLIFIKIAEAWVKSTKNDLDDEWLAGVKAEMKKKKL